MKIKDIAKKFFKQRSSSNVTIASLSDYVILPTREDLQKNPETIELLDSYKKEYIQILSSKRAILSANLTTTTIQEQMTMYIELLMNELEIDESQKLAFEKPYLKEAGEDKINHMVSMSKLKLYFFRIQKLELEAKLHILALKEILEEKPFLSPMKKSAIKEKISNLLCNLQIFLNQKQAIGLEIKSYLERCGLLEEEEFLSTEEEKKLIQTRQQELEKMLSLLSNDFPNPSNNNSDIVTLTLLEEDLEKYVYYHKEDVATLAREIEDLKRKMNYDSKATTAEPPKKESFLPQILDLELKCKAFGTFGRKLISEDLLYTLYTLKFAALTEDLLNKEDFNFAIKSTYVELECYEKIIMDKIDKILRGDQFPITATYPELLPLISRILKGPENEYSFWNILNDQKRLYFLTTFFDAHKLKRLFSMEDEIFNFTFTNFHPAIFKINDTIPLATIYTFMYLNGEQSTDPYFLLYKFVIEKLNIGTLSLVGVTKILDANKSLIQSDKDFIELYRSKIEKQYYQTPSTLESINTNIFQNASFTTLNLSEGLTAIADHSFDKTKATALFLPSSLKDVETFAFNNAEIDEIYLEEDPNLTKESIINLIRSFFYSFKTDYVSLFDPPTQGRFYRFLSKNSKSPETQYRVYEILPKFEELVIKKNGQLISIKKEELRLESYEEEILSVGVKQKVYRNYYMPSKEQTAYIYEELMQIIEKKIQEKAKDHLVLVKKKN